MWKTSDLSLAAYLTCRGLDLTEVRAGPNGRWAEFIFPDEAESLTQEYFRDGLVSARKLMAAVKDLKSRAKHVRFH